MITPKKEINTSKQHVHSQPVGIAFQYLH
jgi:hypothetical protein